MLRITRLITALAAMSVMLLPAAASATAPSLLATAVSPVPAQSVAADADTRPDLALEVLTTDAQDATAITVTPDGRVVFAERMGAIKVITDKGETVEAARIPTNATICFDCPDQSLEEGGVHGLEVSPKFAKNKRGFIVLQDHGDEVWFRNMRVKRLDGERAAPAGTSCFLVKPSLPT